MRCDRANRDYTMNKCEVCGIECKGKTCSGKCRARLSRRTRTEPAHGQGARYDSNEAHAEAIRDLEQSGYYEGTDVPIDYEGRGKDRDTLRTWANGAGYNRSLGRLAIGYTIRQQGKAKAIEQWGKSAVDSVCVKDHTQPQASQATN